MSDILKYSPEELINLIDLKSIQFRNKESNHKISLTSLYDRGYGDLDLLINNQVNREEKKEFLDEWWSNRERNYVANVKVGTDKFDFDVEFRSNFAENIFKRPNVIFLKHDNKPYFVIRIPEDSYPKEVQELIQSSFDFRVNTNLYDHKSITYECPTAIPERLLVHSLNELYELYEHDFPKIIPDTRSFTNYGIEYFIRPWLNESIKDTALDPVVIGEHVGFMRAIGLVGIHDKQIDHYFISNIMGEKNLVNIDPDFQVWLPYSNRYSDTFLYDQELLLEYIVDRHVCFDQKNDRLMKEARNKFKRSKKELTETFYEILKEGF
ncbi:hypothetical protein KY334_01870 [Candidatus Woesearchaeota archaeon]|nr:hypothetical protein [Candidatus Woesearchaeota archaeon]